MSASFTLKRGLAKAAGGLSRLSGRGGGTTLPGRLLVRMAPDAIEQLAAGLERGSIVVSSTNGKTTTAGMIAGILRADGRSPVHNRAGSNMHWGVATALLEQQGDEGLFELDEAWLPRVAPQLRPRLLVLGNLFRDQLDRYGELERLADEWADLVESMTGVGLALCADDPLIADLGRDKELRRREGVTYFGIEDRSQALPELQHAFDAKHCRRCGAPYKYDRAFVGHLGHYTCPNCEAGRPAPDVAATRIELRGMSGSRMEVTTPEGDLELALPLPGLYNVYNALAAITAGLRSGVALATIGEALAATRAVFGRVETIEVEGKPVSILLIKNPAGANEVLRTLSLERGDDGGGLDIWIALNDRIADGRDVSWIWDADFELLSDGVRRVVCAGTRAPEMALRLKYAGMQVSVAD
jgi:UDP-N-acetylmuramyl tripeptide synthase